MNNDIIISAQNFNKSFGDNNVLRDVSLDVKKGEVIAIIGPSGSGKSTFLRCLIGLERVNGGSLTVQDNPVVTNGKYVSDKEMRTAFAKSGMVFQHFNLFPHLTVRQNMTLSPTLVNKVSKEDANKRCEELLAAVGISDKIDAMPSSLSGGQKQRVAIARALMMKPDILLFDEPTSALDPELTGEVLSVMKSLASPSDESERMTMIIVTHEMSFAHDIADRIIFMNDGIIDSEGSPGEMFSSEMSPRLSAFLKSFKREF